VLAAVFFFGVGSVGVRFDHRRSRGLGLAVTGQCASDGDTVLLGSRDLDVPKPIVIGHLDAGLTSVTAAA
jgi:hypothetical protein